MKHYPYRNGSRCDISIENLCIYHLLDGLREGLSHFSKSSRAALIYAVRPDDPIRIYDPQNLLRGHEPRLKELYLENEIVKNNEPSLHTLGSFDQIKPEQNLNLAGLISRGGRSNSIYYQMWFTEHHPDMCSIGPTERWLEHAVWLLCQDFSAENIQCTGISGYVLRDYATHAVRDYIVDRRVEMMGWDTQLRVYPILDAVLGISKTFEEGAKARGVIAFVDPMFLRKIEFMGLSPETERPLIHNLKHVRKLLPAVENSNRILLSDGETIAGITGNVIPKTSIIADFKGSHGFLRLNGELICSYYDGKFHSSTRKAKMVEMEEALLSPDFDSAFSTELFRIVSRIVHYAQDEQFGCTLVIDLNNDPDDIPGQHLKPPPDLMDLDSLELTKSLARLDGALHIGIDLKLIGFACLLDGRAIASEDRARGARYNSALRFSAEHRNIFVVVVSSDRPVSIIQEGVELSAQCEWKPPSGYVAEHPSLKDWL